MTTAYLYIKTHNVTGLKYFGVTVRDPMKYRGSGKDWLRHLREHGYNISTEIYAQFDPDIQGNELRESALLFSAEHDIVDSKEWANLILEGGSLDGFREIIRAGKNLYGHNGEPGFGGENLITGNVLMDVLKNRGTYEEYRRMMSTKMKEYIAKHGNPFQGKTHSVETKRRIGKKSAIHQAGEKNSQYGTMWVYNAVLMVSKRVPRFFLLEDGWKKGRVIDFSLLRPCKGCGDLFHRERASYCTSECKASSKN